MLNPNTQVKIYYENSNEYRIGVIEHKNQESYSYRVRIGRRVYEVPFYLVEAIS